MRATIKHKVEIYIPTFPLPDFFAISRSKISLAVIIRMIESQEMGNFHEIADFVKQVDDETLSKLLEDSNRVRILEEMLCDTLYACLLLRRPFQQAFSKYSNHDNMIIFEVSEPNASSSQGPVYLPRLIADRIPALRRLPRQISFCQGKDLIHLAMYCITKYEQENPQYYNPTVEELVSVAAFGKVMLVDQNVLEKIYRKLPKELLNCKMPVDMFPLIRELPGYDIFLYRNLCEKITQRMWAIRIGHSNLNDRMHLEPIVWSLGKIVFKHFIFFCDTELEVIKIIAKKCPEIIKLTIDLREYKFFYSLEKFVNLIDHFPKLTNIVLLNPQSEHCQFISENNRDVELIESCFN